MAALNNLTVLDTQRSWSVSTCGLSFRHFCGVLVLPSASESFVKRNNCQELIALGAGQRELRGKKLLLSFENFIIAGLACDVTF